MVSAQKAKPAERPYYQQIIENTCDFRFSGSDGTAVRDFLEHGGMRTEIQPVSSKKYGAALCVPEDLKIRIGEPALQKTHTRGPRMCTRQ